MAVNHRDFLMELLVSERRQAGLPVSQQLIQLDNLSHTECCRNAPTSMMLGNSVLSRLLSSLPNQDGLLNEIRGLTGCSPGDVGSLRGLSRQLVAAVPAATECFAGYQRQQDPQEWLAYLLDGLEQEMPAIMRDPFVSMFKVQTEVTSQCTTNEQHKKSRLEVDRIISVPVQHPDTEDNFNSLSQCLDSYFCDEQVHLDCQWCDCHQAQQSRHVIADPDVLVIHLKRFNKGGQKLGHKIQFGPKLMGMSDDRPYVFTGAVVHSGNSLESGHYRSVICCLQTSRLFLLDDSKAPQLLPTDRQSHGRYVQGCLSAHLQQGR